MSDTVFENDEISFTRFWGGKKQDCVQITMQGDSRRSGYAQITLEDFRQAYRAIEKSVEETKDAFWHLL